MKGGLREFKQLLVEGKHFHSQQNENSKQLELDESMPGDFLLINNVFPKYY